MIETQEADWWDMQDVRETGRKNARRKPRRRWKDAVRMGTRRGADRFWWGKQKERVRVAGLQVEGMIILKRTLKTGVGGMDWVDLAQDRDS